MVTDEFYQILYGLYYKYVKLLRPPILKSYTTFNRDIEEISKPVRLIEPCTLRYQTFIQVCTGCSAVQEPILIIETQE